MIKRWYCFYNFDSQTRVSEKDASPVKEILSSLVYMLNNYRRLPHTIIILLGNKLMMDKTLNQSNKQMHRVLMVMGQRIVKLVATWIDDIPSKCLPIDKPQIFITKPLPQPQAFFISKPKSFDKLTTIRKAYNDQLVSAVKDSGIGFINVKITQEDSDYFSRNTHSSHNFVLNDKGLHAYWHNISATLDHLHSLPLNRKHHRSEDLRLKLNTHSSAESHPTARINQTPSNRTVYYLPQPPKRPNKPNFR